MKRDGPTRGVAHQAIDTMINTKLLADRLSGLCRRLRLRNGGRRRRCPGNHRLQGAAEVALLEPRCLLSGKGVGGGHHGHRVALNQPGDPSVINFAGYEWNANYNWSKDSGPFINGQLWSPDN